MKVSEAKTKVCNIMPEYLHTINGNAHCICGGCMSWQWNKKTVHTVESEKRSDGRFYQVDKKKKINSSDEGYCKRLGE